jgi:sec-independent protein translocase protein TatC
MKNEETEFLGQMPLMSHLTELRRRLIKSFLAILVSFAVAFFFSEEIINYLKIPLNN